MIVTRSGGKGQGKIMNFEELKKELIMSNGELKEIVDIHMKDISVEVITEMIVSIVEQQSEEGRQAMAESTAMMKLAYIATEVYKMGYMYALYTYNDAIKKELDELAPVQLAEHKR